MRLQDKVALITGAAHGVKGEMMGFGRRVGVDVRGGGRQGRSYGR